MSYTNRRDDTVSYAKFQPCNLDKEDMQTYGLTNQDMEWEKFAVELYRNNAGDILYKHVGISTQMGEAYCLGDKVFGNGKDKQTFPTQYSNSLLRVGEAKDVLSNILSGHDISAVTGTSDDFVLLFACEGNSANSVKSMKSYFDSIASTSAQADFGMWARVFGTMLGYPTTLQHQTTSKREFTVPHYCQHNGGACGLEPLKDTAGCFEVDSCFYDRSACGGNAFCQSDGSSCECESGYLRYAFMPESN